MYNNDDDNSNDNNNSVLANDELDKCRTNLICPRQPALARQYPVSHCQDLLIDEAAQAQCVKLCHQVISAGD